MKNLLVLATEKVTAAATIAVSVCVAMAVIGCSFEGDFLNTPDFPAETMTRSSVSVSVLDDTRRQCQIYVDTTSIESAALSSQERVKSDPAIKRFKASLQNMDPADAVELGEFCKSVNEARAVKQQFLADTTHRRKAEYANLKQTTAAKYY